MTVQFGRAASLLIGPAQGGQALQLAALHFTFTVARATINTPQTCDIKIYNLSDATAKYIFGLQPASAIAKLGYPTSASSQIDGGQVQLSAGYSGFLASNTNLLAEGPSGLQELPPATVSSAGNVGIIFSGQIRQVLRGRDNATDTYLEIIATDSDQAYNYGMCATTLSAGWTAQDMVNAINQSMAPFGVTPGKYAAMSPNKGARGKVMYGMSRSFGRQVAINNKVNWSVYNGQTMTIAEAGGLPGVAIDVNSATGMIDIPQQTLDGIELHTLLDPRVVPGSYIKLNNADIVGFTLSQDYTAAQYVPNIENDGYYRVYWLERSGDNRGQDWFNHIICVGATAPLPPTGTYIETLSQ